MNRQSAAALLAIAALAFAGCSAMDNDMASHAVDIPDDAPETGNTLQNPSPSPSPAAQPDGPQEPGN